MSDYGFVAADMDGAQAAASGAAAEARGADGSDALTTLASALPGSSTAAALGDLAGLWQTGIQDWSEGAAAYGDSVAAAKREGTTTDSGVSDIFGGLLGGP